MEKFIYLILGGSITLNLVFISIFIVFFYYKKYNEKEINKIVENENDFKYFFGGKI